MQLPKLVKSRQLLAELPEKLLQGVSLESAIRGFGTYWESIAPSELPPRDASRQVSEYDAFLSHDWATHRLLKILSLHLHFNGVPAAMASLFVGLVVGLLEAWGWFLWPRITESLIVQGRNLELQVSIWSYVLSLGTFLVVFCFWQRIRGLLGRSRFVFLDKLCISQTDPELKAQGVLGLAGFLAHSKSLVILWSPKYFTRLWCAYEVATWLRLADTRKKQNLEMRRATVIPVNLSILLVLSFLQISVNCLWGLAEACWLHMGGPAGYCPIVMCGILVNGFINMVVAEGLARDLAELPKQLDRFDVRKVQCFCCSCGHVDPDTGEVLPCDRELVYKSLEVCFECSSEGGEGGLEGALDLEARSDCSERGQEEAALEAFNEAVRTRFAPAILHEAGGEGLTYYQAWFCSGLPYLLAHARRISSVRTAGWGPALVLAADSMATGLLVIPTCVKVLNLLAAVPLWSSEGKGAAWLCTTSRALAYAATCYAAWFPLQLAVQHSSPWPLVGTILANLAFTLIVFAGPRLAASLPPLALTKQASGLGMH